MPQATLPLSRRARELKESATLAIDAKAKALKAQGKDVVGFGAGEPDFDTPAFIKDAAKRSLDAGETKYVDPKGILPLRQAVADKLKRDNGLSFAPDQVLVTCGAKQALYNVLMVAVEEGDEVILPSPCWVSYPEMVRLAGGTPVLLPTDESDGFKVRPEALRKALTPKTKMILFNSPSNPTGAVQEESEFRALSPVLESTNAWILSDEIYERLVYGGAKFASPAALSDGIRARTIVVNGFSKTYAMTGWRLGYAAGPKDLIAAAGRLQSQTTSNATSFIQKAAIEALKSAEPDIRRMIEAFDRRRKRMIERLRNIPGVSIVEPKGAFYAFANVSRLFGKSWNGKKIAGSMDFAAALLEGANVAVVPGFPFGSDAHIRLSYALSDAEMEKGLDRIEAFAKGLA